MKKAARLLIELDIKPSDPEVKQITWWRISTTDWTAGTSLRTWLSLTWQTEQNSPAMTLRPSQSIFNLDVDECLVEWDNFKRSCVWSGTKSLRGPSDVVKNITT